MDNAPQSEPSLSLGGFRGSEISSVSMKNIFGHISSSSSANGSTEYRCICVKNDSLDALSSARVWIQGDIEIGVEPPSFQSSGCAQSIPDAYTAPIGIIFHRDCVSYETGLPIGSLNPGDIYFIWIKRTNEAGSQAAYDSFRIWVQGARATSLQFREKQITSAFYPNTSFSLEGASKFRMYSPMGAIGEGYLLFHFNRNDIDEKTLKITWNGSYDPDTPSADRAYAHIMVLDGTLDASVDSDWPVGGPFKGNGILYIVSKVSDNNKPSTFSETATYDIHLSTGVYNTCTLAVVLTDAWISSTITVDIDKIEVLDGSKVVFSCDFSSTDTIVMERAGTYSDYGHIVITETISSSVLSSYCIVDARTPSTRMVIDNGLIKLRSRIESDDCPGSIDMWIRGETGWLYLGRIKPQATNFDEDCPWSRIYTHYMDYNKTVVRFYYTSTIYMDVTLARGSQGIKMQWGSGETGYTYLDINPRYRGRFGYGEGADPVDAKLVTDGWKSLGVTNNWSIVWGDDQDYFIGLALTDDAVAPRCYVENGKVSRIGLGAGSDLSKPHFFYFARRVANTLYTYNMALLYGGSKIVTDSGASEGYSIKVLSADGVDTSINDDTDIVLRNGSYTRAGTKTTYSFDTTITRLGFKLSKWRSPTGNVSFAIRRVSDDSILASVVWGDASSLTLTPTWYESSIGPVTVNGEVRICVEFSGGDNDNFVRLRIDYPGTKPNHNLTMYSGAWSDSSSDCAFKIYYSVACMSWNVRNICDDYRLVVRRNSGTGYGFSDSAGTKTTGRSNEYFYGVDYYYDYLLYIPKKYSIKISGPGDIAKELLCEWDYGIAPTQNNNYEIYPTYSVLKNDWNITPTNIICLPESLDTSSETISYYRALKKDNMVRYGVEDSTNTPGAWYEDMAKIGYFSMNSPVAKVVQYKIIGNRTLYRLGFMLSKYNSPSGTIYFRVRNATTKELLASIAWGDASALTTSLTWYEASLATPITLNGAVYIGVEMDTPPNSPHAINIGVWYPNKRDAEYLVYYDGTWHDYPVNELSYKLYFNSPITGTKWGIDDKAKIDADDAYCWIANDTSPETITWNIDIPKEYTWAFVRLHAQTDGVMGYQIRSDNVGTTYYTLTSLYYDTEDSGEQYPIKQYWTYFEGYFRVSPNMTNTIRLNCIGASGDQRHVVDYIEIAPVRIAPFIVSQNKTITVRLTKKITEQIWRSHYYSENVRGRARFNFLKTKGINMNQKMMLGFVAEHATISEPAFPLMFPVLWPSGPTPAITGRIYYNAANKKFYGYNGTTWVEL